MKEFANRIKEQNVEKGTAAIFFLGQAGFILKNSTGHLIAYDLYLSDCCEREFGFKRMLAKLLQPGELEFDAVFCSHGHYDHLDIDSIAALIKPEKTVCYTTQDGMEELAKLGIVRATQIRRGETFSVCGGVVTAHFVYCDHGELAPYAVGSVMEIEGKKLYFAGDTAYRPEQLVNDYTKNCDFAALPINGAFGNLDEEEAAKLAAKLQPKITVPCHFWNFAEHGGDPARFMTYAKEQNINYRLMAQGDCLII